MKNIIVQISQLLSPSKKKSNRSINILNNITNLSIHSYVHELFLLKVHGQFQIKFV